MAAVMSGFKDGRQVIVPVPLEFTGVTRFSQQLLPNVVLIKFYQIGFFYQTRANSAF
jgi:hypothetical protein